jgi:hypothetical protein
MWLQTVFIPENTPSVQCPVKVMTTVQIVGTVRSVITVPMT